MNRDFSRAPAPFDSDGHRHGAATVAAAATAAASVAPDASSASGAAPYVPAAAAYSARVVAMEKRPDERSFGMTLEQQRVVSSLDFPRVSFVFPDLAASRAGLSSGCVIEAVDHRSVQGCSVKVVAALFRARTRVTIQVRWPSDPSPHATAPAVVAASSPAPQSLPPPVPTVSAAPLPATASIAAPVPQAFAAGNSWAPASSQSLAPPRPDAVSQTVTTTATAMPAPVMTTATRGSSQQPAMTNTQQIPVALGTPLLPPNHQLMTTAAHTMLVSTLQAVVESQKRALTMALQSVSRPTDAKTTTATAAASPPMIPSAPVQSSGHVTQPQPPQPSAPVQATTSAAERKPPVSTPATNALSPPPAFTRDATPQPQPEPPVAGPHMSQKTEAVQPPHSLATVQSLPAAPAPRPQPVQAPVPAPVPVPAPPAAPAPPAPTPSTDKRVAVDATSSAPVAAPTQTPMAPVYQSPERSAVGSASYKSPTRATSPSTVNITALLPNVTRLPPSTSSVSRQQPVASSIAATAAMTTASDGSQTPRGSGKKRARPSTSPTNSSSNSSRNRGSTSQAVAHRPPPIPDTTSTQPQNNGYAPSATSISVDRQSETNGPSAHKKPRGGRGSRRRESLTPSDSDDAVCLLGSEAETISSADSSSASSSPSTAGGGRKRRYSTRQSESGGRVRRSLTVDRLVTMGFKREDAEASVGACGHDVEKCMVWIVSHLEEKQFLSDLNQASIESELSKRAEETQQKKQESETLKQATAFTSLFPTSYVLSGDSEAPQLKRLLSSTIGCISAETLMRTTLTRLLKLEAQAIRWYKEASRCYMLQLARRLEAAMDSHDVVSCCAQWMASDAASRSSCCAFVQTLCSEEQALTTALFHMPENHGGVPLEFLRADESMQFSLEDDGFEVLDDVTEID
ncbi:hypothetical protein PINS_up001250 [Pythium insidiosum]|nr:hypothetical protein PINS_up001250 [Pythium insidiosum]